MIERQIVNDVKRHLGERRYTVFEEVPLISRMVDVVGWLESSDELILIEAKVSNWRRALEQASIYLLCGDYVYIAMARQYVQRVDQDQLEHLGIGLLSVNANVVEVIEPRRSALRDNYYSERMVALLSSIKCGEI